MVLDSSVEVEVEVEKPEAKATDNQAQTEPDEEVNAGNGDSGSENAESPSLPVIAVGDRVKVSDCPGHWSWAAPFTVEAINGEWAKLEMVRELVEVNRLSLDCAL